MFLYKEMLEDVDSKRQSIAKFMPLLNSVYPLVLYKNRLVLYGKTIAHVVIDYLDISNFVNNIDAVCRLHEKIQWYHDLATEDEKFYDAGYRSVIMNDNADIRNWLRNACLYLEN